MPSRPATRLTIIALTALLAAPAGRAQEIASTPRTARGCTICDGKARVRCRTCAGRGVEIQACSVCKGAGHGLCRSCGRRPKPRSSRGGLGEEPRSEVEKFRRILEESRARARSQRGWSPKASFPGRESFPRGRVDCPGSACNAGSIRWETGGKNTCRVCAGKGSLKCRGCSCRGAPCKGCAGKKKRTVTCRDCFGSGGLPCPGCQVEATDSHCPWCGGSEECPCNLCERGKHRAGHCGSCGGWGGRLCSSCAGGGRIPCSSCGGCGKVRYKLVDRFTGATTRGGVQGCEECAGRGYERCTFCRKGIHPCSACKGSKRVARLCHDGGKVPCRCVLVGRHAPLETLGDILLAAGDAERALLFFIEARKRATEVRDPLLRDPSLDQLHRLKERERIRARIEKKIAALTKA